MRPVTVDQAAALAEITGTSSTFWLKLQAQYYKSVNQTFRNIAEWWNLSAAQRVALQGEQDRQERVAAQVGIYRSLHLLYSDRLADAWPTLANSNLIFGGQTPADYMAAGGLPTVLEVQRLLESRLHS